jgi:hypothetical protein
MKNKLSPDQDSPLRNAAERSPESTMDSASPSGVKASLVLQQHAHQKNTIHQSPQITLQRKQLEVIRNSETVQRIENNTGLPDKLKSGVEKLSGLSMDEVKVHYNSSKPAQLQAHAYTQGTDIHVAPGQDKHLAHEAWHVVQQKQGRVKPTMQMKDVQINDDSSLEKEADVMGDKANNQPS